MIAPMLIALGLVGGAPPTAVIVGPERGNPGDLIVLDASPSRDAAGFAWVLADSDKTFLEVEGGRKVDFASGTAGRYTFVLIAANAQADGKPQVAVARHVLTVGEPSPGPTPPPPGPQPEPLPPGKYGLAAYARQASAGVPLATVDKQRTAQALAGSFEAIAASIAAGVLKDAPAIVAATTNNNRAALGTAVEPWQPWAELLRGKLNELSTAGQLVTPDDYAIAWREIAVGLRGVR